MTLQPTIDPRNSVFWIVEINHPAPVSYQSLWPVIVAAWFQMIIYLQMILWNLSKVWSKFHTSVSANGSKEQGDWKHREKELHSSQTKMTGLIVAPISSRYWWSQIVCGDELPLLVIEKIVVKAAFHRSCSAEDLVYFRILCWASAFFSEHWIYSCNCPQIWTLKLEMTEQPW